MNGPLVVGIGVSYPQSAFRLDAHFEAEPGQTVALLGPNGAGKSTVLHAVAGLIRPDHGSVRAGDHVFFDSDAGIDIPPEGRSIGYVLQGNALFPHLSALENVAFGLRARGARRAEARRAAEEWLGRVGLSGAGDRRPGELSGGEAQRVSLARALAPEPAVLLLDEPLAALDATVRARTRRDLSLHLSAHAGVCVLVTHDPVEAAVLADRVVVFDEGKVAQSGDLGEIRRRPQGRYAADLVGVNLYPGTAAGGVVTVEGGLVLIAPAAYEITGDVFAVVHPRSVGLSRSRPEGSARNVWEAMVAACEIHDGRARLQLTGPVEVVAEVTDAAVAALELRPGDAVWVAVKATEIDVYPR